jgi:hypothetical protein
MFELWPTHPDIASKLRSQTLSELLSNTTITYTFFSYTLLQVLIFSFAIWKSPATFGYNAKARGWLLTWLVSIPICSVAISFTVNVFYRNRFDVLDCKLGYAAATIFVSFLVTDFILGSIFYPKHFPTSSAIHHICYVIILYDFIRMSIPGFLGPFAMLEFPTFFLAIGSLNRKWRTDLIFGVLFFATRVLFHAFMIYKFLTLMVTTHFWVYALLPWPMHIIWFSKWWKSQFKKIKHKTD